MTAFSAVAPDWSVASLRTSPGKVEDFDHAFAGNDQVLRLDVAVHHISFVRVLQSERRLADVVAGMSNGERALASEHFGQVSALNKFHHEKVR